jgi:hypothetical protein
MSAGTAVCEEYQQLLQELTWALQLCAEYESTVVLSIDTRKLSAERAEQRRDAAARERIRLETRVFAHQCTCVICRRSLLARHASRVDHWCAGATLNPTLSGRIMGNTTEIWKQTLYKSLEDSEFRQTIVIVEDDASIYRVVQRYDLIRNRFGGKTEKLAPRATYCRHSTCETRDLAVLQARRLVAKCLIDDWVLCRDEQTA